MNILMIILRTIHIFGSVLWAGTAFFFVGFLEPTITATGAEGVKVVQHLTQRTRFSTTLSLAALLTTISGIWMYFRIFPGIGVAFSSGPGVGLTLGGLAGLLAAVHGIAVNGRASARMAAIGKEIQAVGGPPNPAQLAELQTLQERLSRGARVTAVLLAIALLGMATARYL